MKFSLHRNRKMLESGLKNPPPRRVRNRQFLYIQRQRKQFTAPLIGLMPQATLAAVVIVYSLGLIKPKDFFEILTIRRTEFIWAC
jgi:hypothetical protein